jgi:hypothetical protein
MGADVQLDFTAAAGDPFRYHHVLGHKVLVGGDIAEVTVTDGKLGEVLKATGLDAPVADILRDLLALQPRDALLDLIRPGPLTVHPHGFGDILRVPGVRAKFDLDKVHAPDKLHPETVELRRGDMACFSRGQFYRIRDVNEDAHRDGHHGYFLTTDDPGHPHDVFDIILPHGEHVTKGALDAYIMLT